ncbi:MAG TPA: serine hydrolase [Variovorax sp.]|nr:serine hydrolase [Variovorax sp.]
MRRLLLLLCLGLTLACAAKAQTAEDRAAFADVERALAEGLPDVQSLVVLQRGRLAYQFHRDGSAETPRVVASVTKSALSTLVGIALGQGRIASLDQPVLELMPEWKESNSDPRSASLTVRHLLTMTAGFDIGDDLTGTARALKPRDAWARPLRAAPGQVFAYDNSLVPMLAAIVEKASGSTIVDFARRELATPLGMGAFDLRDGLRMRTIDMARLGQLYLQKGRWEGQQIVPEAYVTAATQAQSAGGPPVSMPYGYMWWVTPAGQVFMAAGFGGQYIWVYPPLELVVAVHSTPSLQSHLRGQATRLIRNGIFAAAQKRAAAP